MGGWTSRLEEDRCEAVDGGGLFGNPQGVVQLLGLRDQKPRWIDAVKKADARRIGVARLAKTFRQADPQERRRRSLDQKMHKPHDEARSGACVAHAGRMDFGQPRAGQAAAKRSVEPFCPGREEVTLRKAILPPQVHVAMLAIECLGEATFNLRDLMAQGNNGFPRHGRRGHGDTSSEICSCYVLIDSRAISKSQAGPKKNLFLACIPLLLAGFP